MMNKIEQLKKEFEDGSDEALDQISAWEKDIKLANLFKELAEHDGIKIILEDFNNRLNTIKGKLLDDIDLSIDKRAILFAERDWINKFISYFDKSKATLKQVEKQIDNELL